MKNNKWIGVIFLLVLLYGGRVDQVYATECTQHEYKSEVLRFAEPQNDGEREFVCIYCGDTYTEVLPKTGHEYGEYQTEKEATCAKEGLRYRSCIECGQMDYQVIPFLEEHDFSEWDIISQGSCEEPQQRQRICLQCGQVEEVEVEAAQKHDYEETLHPATCQAAGERVYSCKRCGDSYVAETFLALGHKYLAETIEREPTVTEEGLAISVCEHDETHIVERVIPKAIIETEIAEAIETAEPEISPKESVRDVNPIEVTVVSVNMIGFGILFILIKRDYTVLQWEKRNRKRMYERGEWR